MCPYEADIVVTLEVTDVLDGGTIVHGPTNQLMFDVSSTSNVTLSCNSTYNISLLVVNQASESITIHTVYSEFAKFICIEFELKLHYNVGSIAATIEPSQTMTPSTTVTASCGKTSSVLCSLHELEYQLFGFDAQRSITGQLLDYLLY